MAQPDNSDSAALTISYPLFADADMGIYPHAASQYHTRRKAKPGIAMLSVDKFPYLRKQTKGNEFIPCSNDVCHILKHFHSFKTPAIPFILPKSSYNSVLLSRIAAARKVDGGRDHLMIAIVTSSLTFLSRCISCWWRQTLYFTFISQSEARVST